MKKYSIKSIIYIYRTTARCRAALLAGCCAITGLLIHSSLSAQVFPAKPIRIVTSGTGGSNDLVARTVALGMTANLGQPVVVDNRGGPSGTVVAGQIVASSPPDGYTLLSFASSFWLLPFLQPDAPFDPIRDFAPVSLAVTSANILVVHPSLPVRTVQELIALAKARPGQLNYASTATGAPNHLSAELFKSMAGVNIVRVTYKGVSQSMTDLISGRIELAFSSAGSVTPHIKSGALRALAVTSTRPSALFPQLPTMASSGLRDYDSVLMIGMFVAARTPDPIITRLNAEIVKVLQRADIREKFAALGVEAAGSTPQEFAARIKAEMSSMGKLIRDGGI